MTRNHAILCHKILRILFLSQNFLKKSRRFSLLETKTITKVAKMQLQLRVFNLMLVYSLSICPNIIGPIPCSIGELFGLLRQK